MKIMRLKILAASAFVALAACGEQDAVSATLSAREKAKAEPAMCDTVDPDGFCGVKFGMSAEEADAAFPGALVGEPVNDIESEACFYKRRADDDYDVLFMFVDGAFARVDIRSPEIPTVAGAKVGMTLDAVQSLYPGSARKPDFYSAPAENLIVDLGGGSFAIFEEDAAGVVTAYRVGVKPAVDYVEGCA